MGKLVHVRDRDLQSSTFTASPDAEQEDGYLLLQEDGSSKILWDGSASWQVHIIHAPPKETLFHVGIEEVINTIVGEEVTIVDEAAGDIVDETGGTLIGIPGQTWATPAIHV